MATAEKRWIDDGHTVSAKVEQGRINVEFHCPGKDGGCKCVYGCGECDGTGYTGEDECRHCEGDGRDDKATGCWLVSDAEDPDEAYDGPKQYIAPGARIEWWCGGDGEWSWRLLDAPPAVRGDR